MEILQVNNTSGKFASGVKSTTLVANFAASTAGVVDTGGNFMMLTLLPNRIRKKILKIFLFATSVNANGGAPCVLHLGF